MAGDTISKIAKKFNVTPEDLLAANPQVKNPNRIKVGDQLTIPVPGRAEPGSGAQRRGVAQPLTALVPPDGALRLRALRQLSRRRRQICSAGQRRAQAWATSSQ